ncbi:hypothetical protein [Gordonia sp. NPDC058843]|uniref:hypothetical protein n=1 Tax=Gordonia sp. NPDC058843 TaxID=3346648 RepID=UPI0036C5486C
MDSTITERDNDSADQDFARITSATVGVGLGAIAILATIATAALHSADTVPGVCAMVCAGALMTVSHIGMQCQAAILLLRDGRWLPAVLAAAICAATLTALYLLAFHHAAGWYLLLISAVSVAAYAFAVGEGSTRPVSRRAGPAPW